MSRPGAAVTNQASRIERLPTFDRSGAACIGRWDDMYLPDNQRGRPKRAQVARAKRICADCPLLADCRREALVNREEYGVWGGLSEEEREAWWRRHDTRRLQPAAAGTVWLDGRGGQREQVAS